MCVLFCPRNGCRHEVPASFQCGVGCKRPAHARRCRLETVPAQVEKLSSLRILDLTNNRIGNEGLPMSLARLPHLRAIGLKKNALTAVPRVLGYMRSLQEIYLEDNADLQARARTLTLFFSFYLHSFFFLF